MTNNEQQQMRFKTHQQHNGAGNNSNRKHWKRPKTAQYVFFYVLYIYYTNTIYKYHYDDDSITTSLSIPPSHSVNAPGSDQRAQMTFYCCLGPISFFFFDNNNWCRGSGWQDMTGMAQDMSNDDVSWAFGKVFFLFSFDYSQN